MEPLAYGCIADLPAPPASESARLARASAGKRSAVYPRKRRCLRRSTMLRRKRAQITRDGFQRRLPLPNCGCR